MSYSFRNGPYRFVRIKFGVDPRVDPKYRFFQTLDVRFRRDHFKKITELTSNIEIFGLKFRAQMIIQLADLLDHNEELKSILTKSAVSTTVRNFWNFESYILLHL